MPQDRESGGYDYSGGRSAGDYGNSLNPFEDDNPHTDVPRQPSLPHVENRVYKTICIYTAFFTLGICLNVIGPTLVQMEMYYNTDTRTMAWVFTGASICYIVGSALCALLFDRLNQELTMGTTAAISVVLTCIGPFVGGLYGFLAIISAVGIFQGFIDAAGTSYTVCLWEGSRWKEPLLQGVHMTWSVGGAVGALLAKPFLAELNLKEDNSTRCYRESGTSVPRNFSTTELSLATQANWSNGVTPSYMSDNETTGVSDLPEASIESLGYVRFAYVTVGCIAIIPAILFFIAYIGNGPTLLRAQRKTQCKKQERTDEVLAAQSKRFIITLLALMFIFYMLYLVVEVSPGNFLAAFAVMELCWENPQGALVSSILWASQGVGRLLGVPVSAFVSPKVMLLVNLTLQVTAYVAMCFVHFHVSILWISTALLGLGMATTFATGILWTSQYIKITGVTSAILSIGGSLGAITSPIFIGHMFDNYSPMWLVYICLGAAVLQYIFFIISDVFARRNFKAHSTRDSDKKHNVNSAEEMENIQVEKHYNF